MGWFRRSRPAHLATGSSGLPVPVASAPALARTERALQLLAQQSAQLHATIVQLEERVDSMSATLVRREDAPTYDDIIKARLHTEKVAAELSRLEVNLAARIDAVRHPDPVDPRGLTPADSGF